MSTIVVFCLTMFGINVYNLACTDNYWGEQKQVTHTEKVKHCGKLQIDIQTFKLIK